MRHGDALWLTIEDRDLSTLVSRGVLMHVPNHGHQEAVGAFGRAVIAEGQGR